MVEEIKKIGLAESPVQSVSDEGELRNVISNEDKKIKEIEEYPRPVAVVGVSVL